MRAGVRADGGGGADDDSGRVDGDGARPRGIEVNKSHSRVGGRKKSDRCCACCVTGSCVRCSCVLRGVPCTSCVPSRSGKCMNRPERVSRVVRSEVVRGDGGAHADNAGEGGVVQLGNITAFGAQLVQGSQDAGDDVWVSRWRQLVSVYSGSMYDLPGGNVGKEFVG